MLEGGDYVVTPMVESVPVPNQDVLKTGQIKTSDSFSDVSLSSFMPPESLGSPHFSQPARGCIDDQLERKVSSSRADAPAVGPAGHLTCPLPAIPDNKDQEEVNIPVG